MRAHQVLSSEHRELDALVDMARNQAFGDSPPSAVEEVVRAALEFLGRDENVMGLHAALGVDPPSESGSDSGAGYESQDSDAGAGAGVGAGAADSAPGSGGSDVAWLAGGTEKTARALAAAAEASFRRLIDLGSQAKQLRKRPQGRRRKRGRGGALKGPARKRRAEDRRQREEEAEEEEEREGEGEENELERVEREFKKALERPIHLVERPLYAVVEEDGEGDDLLHALASSLSADLGVHGDSALLLLQAFEWDPTLAASAFREDAEAALKKASAPSGPPPPSPSGEGQTGGEWPSRGGRAPALTPRPVRALLCSAVRGVLRRCARQRHVCDGVRPPVLPRVLGRAPHQRGAGGHCAGR